MSETCTHCDRVVDVACATAKARRRCHKVGRPTREGIARAKAFFDRLRGPDPVRLTRGAIHGNWTGSFPFHLDTPPEKS